MLFLLKFLSTMLDVHCACSNGSDSWSYIHAFILLQCCSSANPNYTYNIVTVTVFLCQTHWTMLTTNNALVSPIDFQMNGMCTACTILKAFDNRQFALKSHWKCPHHEKLLKSCGSKFCITFSESFQYLWRYFHKC